MNIRYLKVKYIHNPDSVNSAVNFLTVKNVCTFGFILVLNDSLYYYLEIIRNVWPLSI